MSWTKSVISAYVPNCAKRARKEHACMFVLFRIIRSWKAGWCFLGKDVWSAALVELHALMRQLNGITLGGASVYVFDTDRGLLLYEHNCLCEARA